MTDKEKFISMMYHDDRNSRYMACRFSKEGKPIQKSAQLYQLPLLIENENLYFVTINGFNRYRRRTSECRQINAVFLDLDLHKNDGDCHWEVLLAYHAIKDAIAEGQIIKPNLTIDSGRGLHIYYIFEKSIPYRLSDGNENTAGINAFRLIQKSLAESIVEVLKNCSSLLELDKKTFDISRIVRLPGTFNFKAGKIATILDYDEDYYTFADLMKPKAKKVKNHISKPKIKTKSGKYEYDKALHNIRLSELEKLQEHRNFDCRGTREYMCYIFYNAAVQIYNKETAFKKLVSFRDKFNDISGVSDSQLKALAACIDRNKGTQHEGYYILKKDWIIQNLGISEQEIAELNLFSLSKRQLKKEKTKIDKQEQAMQVVELASSGMKHQSIADTIGISKRTVQTILKNAGKTREYNRKAA